MDRFKKIYKLPVILLVLLLAVLYTGRVIYVNSQWGKSTAAYLPDSGFETWNGLQISLGEEKIYHVAAFLDKYPAVQRYFRYEGSFYETYGGEDEVRAVENMLCVEMKVKNTSEEPQVISPPDEYRLHSGAYENLVDFRVFMDLNQTGNVLELRPGAETSFVLSYELNRKSFKKESYEHLLERDFSILIHGFPDMQYVALEHLEYEGADEEALAMYEQLVSADGIPDINGKEDTPPSTIIPMGGEYVKDGLCISCSSVFITYDNVHDYEGFDDSQIENILQNEEGEYYERGAVDREGNILPMWNSVRQEFYDATPGILFLTLDIYNSGSKKKSIQKIYPYLSYYVGKNLNGLEMLPYTTCENVEITDYFTDSSYELESHERGKVTFAYYFAEAGDYGVNLQEDPLWIDFNSAISPGKVNLKKENPGKGIFMRIQ